MLLMSSISVLAQDYVFRHLTTRSGIVGGYINDIAQDDRGFIWFATSTGLSRFDGTTFVNYRNIEADETSLTNNNVLRLINLNNDRLLLAHLSGIDVLDKSTDTFTKLNISEGLEEFSQVTDMILDDSGDLWVTSQNRLYHFSQPDLYADTLSGETFEISNEDEAFDIRTIEKYENEIWLGTSSGIFVFNPFSKSFREIIPSNGNLLTYTQSVAWELLTGPDGHLYMSMFNGLLRWNNDLNQIEHITDIAGLTEQQLMAAGFQDLMVDSEGHLWIGTSAYGAVRWNLETDEFVEFRPDQQDLNTVNSGDVHFLFEDNQENIWFGYHFLGASLMHNQTWNYQTYVPFPELEQNDPLNILRTVYMDDRSELWGVTSRGLLRNLGTSDQEFIPLDLEELGIAGEYSTLVTLVFSDGNEYYFAANGPGAWMDYLIVFDRNNLDDPYRIIRTPEKTRILAFKAQIIDNKAYLGTYRSSKLLRFNLNKKEFELFDTPYNDEFPDAGFMAVVPEFLRNGEIYTTLYGIAAPDGDKLMHLVFDKETERLRKQTFPAIDISGINAPLYSSYQPGTLYLNSENGLVQINKFDSSYTVLYEDQVALLREGDLIMTEDQEGYIWVSNQTGLIRLDPITESLEYFEIPRDKFVDAPFPGITLRNGEVVFPGVGSYVRFNPSNLRGSQLKGETLITTMQAGKEEFKVVYNNPVPEVDSDQNTLTFNFIGMNFRDPTAVHYRYKILGTNNEQWTNVGSQRSVFIPNLPTGDYTFEVQSGSQFGSFDGESASVSFSVLPPWWNTLPAYLAYLIILGALIFGLFRFQRNRVLNQERERTREKELEQAKEIEKAYENLKAAQEQLVQQEKLASLGQLTAGIAHEIKNPLNFVNNFSELSVELIEEAREELSAFSRQLSAGKSGGVEKGKSPLEGGGSSSLDEDPGDVRKVEEALEILNDIEANLRKIHKHGSRADSIVKSMLEHSRGGAGKIEPVDLNALLKEYVNLSFHGMRASKNPINVDLQYELDEDIKDVPLIAEDFSRVIVNLSNNAFDAMREKLSKTDEKGYSPKLLVRTFKKDQATFIEIIDNGPGISENIKDKILQPFFTTKKGTEGTGLGLSITNDIIKAHGGFLEVSTDNNEGTKITIKLS